MLPEPAYNAIYLRLYYNLTMHRAARLGGRHGQPDESWGPGVAGTEAKDQAGGVPRADGRDRAPGDRWCALVGPSYHSQARGRHVRGAETMLRMYLLQVMFGLSDEGTEDAVLTRGRCSASCNLDLMQEQVPDATTAKFRPCPREGGTRQGPYPRSRCPA